MSENGSEHGYRVFEWIGRHAWPVAAGALIAAIVMAILTPVVADDSEPSFDPSGEIYDTVDVKDGASFGFQFGVYVNENIEVGFLYSRQQSTLTGRGTATTDFTDMPISNYHGVVTYNFSTSDALARPFLFGGLGATHYSPEDAQNTAVDSETRFSTTWGLGAKIYPSPTFGISLMGRWTPTYIKSDPGGIWCGYYGCWVLADAQYSNQFELSAGLSLRF